MYSRALKVSICAAHKNYSRQCRTFQWLTEQTPLKIRSNFHRIFSQMYNVKIVVLHIIGAPGILFLQVKCIDTFSIVDSPFTGVRPWKGTRCVIWEYLYSPAFNLNQWEHDYWLTLEQMKTVPSWGCLRIFVKTTGLQGLLERQWWSGQLFFSLFFRWVVMEVRVTLTNGRVWTQKISFCHLLRTD